MNGDLSALQLMNPSAAQLSKKDQVSFSLTTDYNSFFPLCFSTQFMDSSLSIVWGIPFLSGSSLWAHGRCGVDFAQ